jgi:hypothetical protein
MLNLSKISVPVLLLSATVGLTACQQHETQSSANRTLRGQYASEGYAQRAKGRGLGDGDRLLKTVRTV